MALSHLARSIAESPTLRLNEEARLLKERGEAVINLGIGEPKNKTPLSAVLGAAARLSEGDVKYTPVDGIPSLKKAVIRYTEENYDRLVAPENVIVSSGAKQSLFNVLFTLLNPQDEVIILAPYWVSYPEMVKMIYGIPVIVTPEDGTMIPRLEDIERAVSSYTKAMIVNSPNNPSGAVYPESLVASIVEFCERKDIYLIFDDIYHKLVFDGKTAAAAYRFARKDTDNGKLIVINGISKLYGMTGYRIGWAIASRAIVEVMINVQAQTTSCASLILQAGAGVVNNLPMRQAVEEAARKVREGGSLSRALAAAKLFPPMLVHMIASGEASGRLVHMLERAAAQQSREMENRVMGLTSLLEPLLIVVMGVVVLVIVLAILLPIFEMNQLVR